MKTKIIIGFLSAAALTVSCGRPPAVAGATVWEAPQSLERLPVDVLKVTSGNLVDSITASGVVAGVNEAVVVSETQGIVTEVAFRLGQWVQKGQVLLRVDEQLARINLERAREQLGSARLELEAGERLLQAGGRSQADVSRARSAEAAARAAYEQALKTFNDCTLRAPISGFVASKEQAATLGNYLSPGSRVARIVDTTSLVLDIFVGEREVGLIDVGAPAEVLVPAACPEMVQRGRVEAVAAGSDPATGSFRVRIGWRNMCGERLRSGMSAVAVIRATADRAGLILPSSALVQREGRTGVFVDTNGSAEAREVTVGRRSATQAEIISGLTEGELVVISALPRLRPGTPIDSNLRGESGAWE